MNFTIIVHPEAEKDLEEAYLWYEDKRKGLGYEFLLNIEAGINFIRRNPAVHRIEYKNTRKHLIKRFPYIIIYLISGELIIIIAVLHSKRNPSLSEKRID